MARCSEYCTQHRTATTSNQRLFLMPRFRYVLSSPSMSVTIARAAASARPATAATWLETAARPRAAHRLGRTRASP